MSENKSNSVLILASNSFTGSHFVEYLLEHTDHTVVGVSRSPEYNPVLLPYLYKKKQRPERFEFHQLDVNRQLAAVLELVDRHRPGAVVNYAAQGEVRNSWRWPEQWYRTNCMGIVTFANALKDRDFIRSYVNISTPEVYGSTGQNIVENENYSPSTPYAASKLSGDLFLGALHKKYGFPVVSTRAANLYGIHQQLYRIIPRTIIYIKSGKKLELHGRGESLRAFIHARDVADATYQAMTRGAPGAVYHLAPEGDLISIRALVEMICGMMGRKLEDVAELIDENFGQDSMYSLDSSKIRHELGWRDQISLEQGIEEMIRWIEDEWDAIQRLPHDYIHQNS